MTTLSPAAATAGQGRRFPAWDVALVALGLAGAVSAWLLLVGISAGRGVDQRWAESAMPPTQGGMELARGLMGALRPSVLAVGGVLLVLATGLQRRYDAVLAAFIASGGLLLSAWGLKAVLPRPGTDALANSFPSGHVAMAGAVALTLVFAVTGAWRSVALVPGAALVGVVAATVVALQWHRPSDALGAVMLTLAWGGAGHLVGRGVLAQPVRDLSGREGRR